MSGAHRKLIAELFVSLDGYAFSPKAGPHFDLFGPELGELIQQRVAEPQELLMGRCTYQMLGDAGSPEGTDPLARRMDELPKTVLSHEASMPLPWTPARVVGGELPEVIGPAHERAWADAADDRRVASSVLSSPLSLRARRSFSRRRPSTSSARKRSATGRLRRGSRRR
jgi:hypothetical protein